VLPFPRPESDLVTARRPTAVVYPVHGIAEIVGEETRTIDGHVTTYVILYIAGDYRVDDLRILVQQDRFDEIGIRSAMSKETADDVLDVLAVANPRLSKTWARRYKNHQAKLKSGDVFDLAEVVRNLAVLQRTKTLGAAEKALYRQARTALVSELAVTWETSKDAAADRVDHALQP
jgi:CarD family transcriptional regulator